MFAEVKFHRVCYSVALALTLIPEAGFGADADKGSTLAHRWCEACHVVAPAQAGTSTDAAPPFATIAAGSGYDAGKIALFLLEPHPKMPNMSLTRTDAADLAAYIGSLSK